MSIRKLINETVEETTIDVKHGKEVYKVAGKPSAAMVGRALAPLEGNIAARMAHWHKVTGEKFDEGMAANVFLVQATLVDDEGPKDGSGRFDETEIAALAAKHGALFLKLTKAAVKVLGLTDEELMAKIAVGESEGTGSPEN